MRPGQQQQNKQRMRGRNGRKGPNPMSRSFESNGPDVKIRGTAQHIADKYTTLARDAAASGDRVMAENYLQHAEHYGRIVAAAQGQFQPSQPERDFDDFEDGDEEGMGGEFAPAQGERPQGERQPNQPYAQNGQSERPPREARDHNGGYRERDNRGDRDNRQDRGERQDRGDRQDRGERNDRRDFRNDRGDRPFNRDRNENGGRDNNGGYRERDNRDRGNNQPYGAGPQPYPREEGDEARAAQGEGQPRFEGQNNRGDRQNRRDRPRLNERSGERRFEERFGRNIGSDENRATQQGDSGNEEHAAAPAANFTPASGEDAPVRNVAPVEAPVANVRASEVPATAPTSAPEPVAGPVAAADVKPVEPATAADVSGEAEPRRRTRARRERTETEAPVVAVVETAAEPVAEAPKRRVAAKPAAVEAEASPEVDATEPKRRPGRPRKKKGDDEGGEGGEGNVPDFRLASNG